MGTYINPGNEAFEAIVRDDYVDKTGLIGLVNEVVNTPRKLVCVSRPRRFGKSFAAESLVAYYCHGCDSRALFEGLDAAHTPKFGEYLNAFNVVRLDMTSFTGSVGADVVPEVTRVLIDEVRRDFPEARQSQLLTETLLEVKRATGRKFVFVIDEWDAVFREAADNPTAQEKYVKFLRLLFKNASFTSEAIAATYMTGILPIKRYGTQSAMTDFREFTMVRPFRFAPYVGFTESEVESLADMFGLPIAELRKWYDGYLLPQAGHVYAPFSVMEACRNGTIGSYWTSSETYEGLRFYIDMDFDGLQADIVRALGGETLRVDPGKFQNDMTSINNRDDALTLLIHLGYLAYDEETGRARIPNEEIRREFRRALEESRHTEVARMVRDSTLLLESLIAGDERAVSEGIQRVHDGTCAPTFYNNEQALRAVVRAALVAAIDEYAIIDELPSGHGIADVAYVPKRGSALPALLVELKWDEPTQTAIDQIHDRDYPQVFRGLDMPLMVVGITYDAKTKAHACRIEQMHLESPPSCRIMGKLHDGA